MEISWVQLKLTGFVMDYLKKGAFEDKFEVFSLRTQFSIQNQHFAKDTRVVFVKYMSYMYAFGELHVNHALNHLHQLNLGIIRVHEIFKEAKCEAFY